MITLDASLLIAHLQPRDPHHPPATAFLRERADEPVLIHSLNFGEVLVGGVRAGRARRSARHRAADLHEGESLQLAASRLETGLMLPDCCALGAAMASGSSLATFDV